jgi:ketosteroid isomerase-like protein
MVILRTLVALAVITSLLAVGLPAQPNTISTTKDSAAAVETVHRFHKLLASGDSAAAVQLLAPDLVVLESGGVETRAEYLGHHLGADMQFAKAVRSERRVVAFHQEGDVVWVTVTSTSRGEFRDRKIDSRGAELVVLARSGSGWLIRAIHWSSRRNSS